MKVKTAKKTAIDMGTLENRNIASMGYRLESSGEGRRLEALLKVCGLAAPDDQFADETTYLMATTAAGGVAASVGWTIMGARRAVIHSLAVAPSSRGIGIGASLLATAMRHLREVAEVEAIYLSGQGISGYFKRLGFVEVDDGELPSAVATHPTFDGGSSQAMVRRYGGERRGLDRCAFCLIHNTTRDATLPEGSVFWFRQSGAVLEAQYRGGTVRRGHLLGAMDGQSLRFCWQACTDDGQLLHGDGEILVELLDDGRRELREKLGDNPGELLLREL